MKVRALAAVAVLVVLAACSSKSPTAPQPHSPSLDEVVTTPGATPNSGGMGSAH